MVSEINHDISEMLSTGHQALGLWINNTGELHERFQNGTPFPNVEIEGFFKPEIAESLYAAFPTITDNQKWIIYNNPIEKKYALTDFSTLGLYSALFALLQADPFVELIRKISGINNLESDPYLHGAGIHQHVRGGKLDMHLDYSIHPITGKERRVKLIIYLTKNWQEDYGGAIELWNEDFTSCEKKLSPCFNKAILFRTSDVSYHGLPHPLKCPDDNSRKSLAIYYMSDPRPNLTNIRFKAKFRPLPTQPVNAKLEKLYRIRENRIITKEDLDNIYPNWEIESSDFW